MAEEETLSRRQDDRQHSASDVWRVVTDQGKSIVALQTGVARLESRFEGHFSQLSAQLQSFNNTIDRVARPADAKGWISVAIAITVVLGSIGVTTIMPIQRQAVSNYEEIREITQEQHYSRGLRDARQEGIGRTIDDLHRRIELLEQELR